MAGPLRIVLATPLPEHLCTVIEDRLGTRIELIREQALLPPERWPADFAGDPTFRRDAAHQRRFDSLVDSADVLFGIPDVEPTALARTVKANPRLRWVQAMAAGAGAQVRAARLSDAELRRVTVTSGAGVHAGPLSEFALLGLLMGAKDVPRLQADQKGRHWPDRWTMGQVADRTVMVVGLGSVGRETARKAHALGARVIGVNRTATPLPYVSELVAPGDIVAAASRADAVVNTLPGSTATDGLISREVLAELRHGATFVSVGRGTVVDEKSLIGALQSGTIGFAAMDVFSAEPLSADSPLWAMPQVLVSPHTAANSHDEQPLLADLFCENVERYLRSEPLRNVIDPMTFT